MPASRKDLIVSLLIAVLVLGSLIVFESNRIMHNVSIAVAAAESAESSADEAKSSADDAASDAQDAKSAADDAASDASDAKSAAEDADNR